MFLLPKYFGFIDRKLYRTVCIMKTINISNKNTYYKLKLRTIYFYVTMFDNIGWLMSVFL